MELTAILNQVLAILTIISQVAIVLMVVNLIFSKSAPGAFFIKHALQLAFAIAFTATAASLFYSEVAGYEPCKLCWFQRIFMYPQTILFALALWKKDYSVFIYSIVLSVIGAFIAGYHYLLQLGVAPALPCSAVGYSVSCSQRFVLEFGYITIPMMALTAFVSLLVIGLAARKTAT